MIGLDTNVLLRLLLGDDARQEVAAGRLFATATRDGTPLFVSDAVLCEISWVVRRQYRFDRARTANLLLEVVQTAGVVVVDSGAVERAIRDYRAGAGDFSDYLIRERALAAGATEIVTFDRILKREHSVRVLGA